MDNDTEEFGPKHRFILYFSAVTWAISIALLVSIMSAKLSMVSAEPEPSHDAIVKVLLLDSSK